MIKTVNPIRTAVELHKFLSKKRNFHFNEGNGRDTGLYKKLKTSLQLSDGVFLSALDEKKVSAEEYLRALIAIAEPLAAMYKDILSYCEQANFLKSKDGASLEWKIASAEGEIEFSFETFRMYEEIKTDMDPPSRDLMITTKNETMTWLAHDVFAPGHAGLPNRNLDWRNIEIFGILGSAMSRLGSEYEGIFMGLHNYYLNGTGAQPSVQLAARVIGHKEYPHRLSAVRKAFSPVDIELIASNFIELPFWKFRWQVYEIWIITVSISEFQLLGMQLVNNEAPQSLIELGSPALLAKNEEASSFLVYQPTYLNRDKKEIRPDIIICSDAKATPAAVQLIIECKQRLNLDVTHLNDVCKKYEAGIHGSLGELVITNYDEVPIWASSNTAMTTLIGHVYPRSDGETQFRKFLRNSHVAISLRSEVWFVDVSMSMEVVLTDSFRQALQEREKSLGADKFRLFSFALEVLAQSPSKVHANVGLSRSPHDDNWEGHGIAALCVEVRKFLSEKSMQLFIVSDVAEEIKSGLIGHDMRRIQFIEPGQTL